METYGIVEVYLYSYLISVLDSDGWAALPSGIKCQISIGWDDK
jgi:hypothetical protein